MTKTKPVAIPNKTIEFSPELLAEALERTAKCVSKDNLRAEDLRAVLFDSHQNCLRLTSTDTYKMTRVTTQIPYSGPAFGLLGDHAAKIARECKGKYLCSLEIDYIERSVTHNYLDGRTTYQMVDGKFLTFDKFIKKWKQEAKEAPKASIMLDAQLLTDLTTKKNRAVKLTIYPKNITTLPITVDQTVPFDRLKIESYLMPVKSND